jgi:hypothetical protein
VINYYEKSYKKVYNRTDDDGFKKKENVQDSRKSSKNNSNKFSGNNSSILNKSVFLNLTLSFIYHL